MVLHYIIVHTIKILYKISNLCDPLLINQRYRRTDGQTDRRHALAIPCSHAVH